METKYDVNISNEAIAANLHRIINQIYKLLPNREEGLDWYKPLDTITEEIAGMVRVLTTEQDLVFSLLCKLEGLKSLVSEEDFLLYRRIIFECLSICNDLKRKCLKEEG